MNRDSNGYTFGFAAAMVLVVASVLAFTASSLKDLQSENVRKEKMQNILSTIGVETDREGAEELFNNYIVEQLALRNDGTVDENVDAFSDVKLALELKKDVETQRFPLYVASCYKSIIFCLACFHFNCFSVINLILYHFIRQFFIV